MRRSSTRALVWFMAAALLAGCSLPFALPGAETHLDGIGDPYYAQLGNPGYDVTYYTIALDVDPATDEIRGTTTIEAIATQPLASLNLDFQGLSVDEVLVNGAATGSSSTDHELTVRPIAALTKGASFWIRVRYHGNPQPVPSLASTGVGGRTIDTVGWFHDDSGAINVINEPNGAASWFPVNDHPRDKAAYRFEITVPDPWMVAAPGTLVQSVSDGGRTLFVWEMDQPMASYLASINVGKYSLDTQTGPDGIVIRNYLTPGLPREAQAAIHALPEMIRFFSNLFGPYPFDEYGVLIASGDIDVCRGRGTAEEVQTLSIHCPNSMMLSEYVIAHELAHMWFGDDVSLENWQDVWLKEGMATYAGWLWEARDRDLKGLTSFARIQGTLYTNETMIGRPPPTDLYDDEVYTGGAMVFHALRLRVGDEAFFKILRTYLTRYHFANAGTDEFEAVAEAVSGQELSSFFDSWLLHTTLPELKSP